MDSERIITVFVERMRLQRYSANTIKSYREYLKLFLESMQHYEKLALIPVEEIESFINHKVKNGNISASYQRSLVGAIKKASDLLFT